MSAPVPAQRILQLAVVFTLVGSSVAFSAERFPAATWRRVKTYDMSELQKMEPLPMRKIVGVRFNYRHAEIRHLKPNWYQGSIWRYRREGARDKFDHIQVMVAKNDLEPFRAISDDFQAGRQYVVYGQVLEDPDAKFIFLRLLGTKVKRDSKGRVTVSW
ncbi:MAG: hypothetical protein ABR589_05840 [Chthoniobacterales bacterium]